MSFVIVSLRVRAFPGFPVFYLRNEDFSHPPIACSPRHIAGVVPICVMAQRSFLPAEGFPSRDTDSATCEAACPSANGSSLRSSHTPDCSSEKCSAACANSSADKSVALFVGAHILGRRVIGVKAGEQRRARGAAANVKAVLGAEIQSRHTGGGMEAQNWGLGDQRRAMHLRVAALGADGLRGLGEGGAEGQRQGEGPCGQRREPVPEVEDCHFSFLSSIRARPGESRSRAGRSAFQPRKRLLAEFCDGFFSIFFAGAPGAGP